MIWERLSLCCCFVCLFCFLSLSVSCCVLVGVCFFLSLFFWGGRGLGWVVLLKIPWSIYLMLFRVTNLSALLLPYFTMMRFLLLHGSGNQIVFLFFFFFFFPILVLVFLGMMSIPLLPHSSWLFPISQHCFSININISWFLLLWQDNIYYVIFTKHCCMYMILSWLRLGSGGPCLYGFFSPPHQT